MIDLLSGIDRLRLRQEGKPELVFRPSEILRFSTAETHNSPLSHDSSPAAPAPQPKPPPPLFAGRFQLREKLNEGGQGTVYLAYDEQLQRNVALKISHSGNEENPIEFSRIQREGTLLAKLNHPSLPQVYESGFSDETFYLVLEYVAGKHLGEVCGRLSRRQIARIIHEIATAVAAVHRANILHLDLKPENVILTPEGRCKLVDFGVAWVRNEADCQSLVHRCGTPGYMAPEQLAARTGDWTTATDVFGMGAILHFLLHGIPPLKTTINNAGEADEELKSAISRLESDRASPRLARLCRQALQPDPDQRIATAEEFARAINRPTRLVQRSFSLALFACGALLIWLGIVGTLQKEASPRMDKSEVSTPRMKLQTREMFLKLEVRTETSEEPRVAIWSPGLGFHEIRGMRKDWKNGKFLWSPRTRNGRMVTHLDDDLIAIVVLPFSKHQGRFPDGLLQTSLLSGARIGPEETDFQFIDHSGSLGPADEDSSSLPQAKSHYPTPYFCLISKAPDRKGEIWSLAAEIDLPGRKATLLPMHFQMPQKSVKHRRQLN